jgi:hypothetical protein
MMHGSIWNFLITATHASFRQTTAKRRRFRIGLLEAIGAGALSVGLEAASNQADLETGTAPDEAARLCHLNER